MGHDTRNTRTTRKSTQPKYVEPAQPTIHCVTILAHPNIPSHQATTTPRRPDPNRPPTLARHPRRPAPHPHAAAQPPPPPARPPPPGASREAQEVPSPPAPPRPRPQTETDSLPRSARTSRGGGHSQTVIGHSDTSTSSSSSTVAAHRQSAFSARRRCNQG